MQYVSRCFRGSDKAWSTIEKEAYAIVYALTKLRPYLHGAKFVIYTDHKPLKSLFLSEVKNTKIQRWSSLIAEYAAPIEHYKGKLNIRADMLSRIPNRTDNPIEISAETADDAEWIYAAANPADSLPWLYDNLDQNEVSAGQHEMPEWDRAGEENSQYQIVGNLLWSTKNLTLEQPFPRLVLPEQYRENVVKRCHRDVGHQSVDRDWVIKGFGMSSLVYATGHIKDPVPLVEKSRGLSPGGRFPPSFIHQVVIITGLNKLQLYVLALKMALDADRA